MKTTKGYFVKHSFGADFVNKMNEINQQYGEDVLAVHGIANKFMDIAEFSHNFFQTSASVTVADLQVDSNANVGSDKNITQYNFENNKAIGKLNSLNTMYELVTKYFDKEQADECLENLVTGKIFLNDAVNFQMPYCYSFATSEIIYNGMRFGKTLNLNIKPPKSARSYINLIIQFISFASNQILGACALPDLFVNLNWFYEKDLGKNYIDLIRSSEDSKERHDLIYRVKNDFQNLIYSFNFPFRGNQSAFVNVSVLDRSFLSALFKGYMYPDYTKPNIENIYELSKFFFEYFTEIQCKESVFTFPVVTLAHGIDKDKNKLDPEFWDWSAEVCSKKACANILISETNSFSSCCRLKNQLDTPIENTSSSELGMSNSFGVGGISIGSHRVCGINMYRLAQLEDEDENAADNAIDCCWKILYSHRKHIQSLIERGVFPLYTYNYMDLKRQYSTFGFIGAYEYVLYKCQFDEQRAKDIGYDEYLIPFLQDLEEKIKGYQDKYKKDYVICNIEQIPGESMAVRLAQIDKLLGYNDRFEFYSNQYIPTADSASIHERLEIEGKVNVLCSGGSICHINVDDSEPLSTEQFSRIMEVARETGATYFAINYCYSECEDGHFIIGKHDVCPICRKKIVNNYTRVVGFVTPVKNWNKTRRRVDFPTRKFYNNDSL